VMTVSFPLTTAAYGSPVVNAYGEAIGLAVSPGTWPGWTSRNVLRFNRAPSLESAVLMVTPLKRIDVGSTGVPLSLDALRDRGEFMQPLTDSEHIGQALLLRQIDDQRLSAGMMPMQGDFEFSRSIGELIVFVYWNPLAELKTNYRLEIYDLDNQPLFRGETRHLELKAYTRSHTVWNLSIGNLPPATYRADLIMEGQAVWRGFFKIVE